MRAKAVFMLAAVVACTEVEEGRQGEASRVSGQYEDLPYPAITPADWARERGWYLARTACQAGLCRAEQEKRPLPLKHMYTLPLPLLSHYLYRVSLACKAR